MDDRSARMIVLPALRDALGRKNISENLCGPTGNRQLIAVFSSLVLITRMRDSRPSSLGHLFFSPNSELNHHRLKPVGLKVPIDGGLESAKAASSLWGNMEVTISFL
jgi:hypothetical protein